MPSLTEILKPLDPHGSQPLYQQLQRALRDAIERRLLSPDDALPAERQIASELAVSRITVRKAIDGLVEEGLLVRRQGSGNFVASRIEKNFARITSFSEDMRARGRTAGDRLGLCCCWPWRWSCSSGSARTRDADPSCGR